MSALFKLAVYVLFLLSALAISLHFLEWLSPENVASAPAKPEAAAAPVDPAGTAAIDEELDYWAAQKIGSLDGWRSFLAAHGSGVYAQAARTEMQKLLPAEKASAPAKPEATSAASPDGNALAAYPRGTEAASFTPDDICKRDGDRLARLRDSRSSEEAARFANELGCEKLRPQLLGLMESWGRAASAPASAELPNGSSLDAKAAGVARGTAFAVEYEHGQRPTIAESSPRLSGSGYHWPSKATPGRNSVSHSCTSLGKESK